jgi:hypothetical protein
LIKNPDESLKKLGKYGSTSIKTALDIRNHFYDKPLACLKCKYQLICDGIEKNISHLSNTCFPSNGKIIKNFMEFLK